MLLQLNSPDPGKSAPQTPTVLSNTVQPGGTGAQHSLLPLPPPSSKKPLQTPELYKGLRTTPLSRVQYWWRVIGERVLKIRLVSGKIFLLPQFHPPPPRVGNLPETEDRGSATHTPHSRVNDKVSIPDSDSRSPYWNACGRLGVHCQALEKRET